MSIESLKMIIEAFGKVGGEAKELVIWYFVYNFVQCIMVFTFFVLLILIAWKVINIFIMYKKYEKDWCHKLLGYTTRYFDNSDRIKLVKAIDDMIYERDKEKG